MLCHGDLDPYEWSDATTRRMLRLLPSLRTGSGSETRWLVLLTKEMVLIQPGQLITFLFRPGNKMGPLDPLGQCSSSDFLKYCVATELDV